MKKTTKFALSFFIAFLFILGIGYFSNISFTDTAKAGNVSEDDDLKGWMWADTTGWAKLNKCDLFPNCDTHSYGVDVSTTTGELSGQAWSDNLGWISFEQTAYADGKACPTTGAGPKIDLTTTVTNSEGISVHPMSGCARVLSGVGRTDGWDGWISFAGTVGGDGEYKYANYNAQTGELVGFVWGGEPLGWFEIINAVGPVINPPEVVCTPPAVNCSPPPITTGVSASPSCGADGLTPTATVTYNLSTGVGPIDYNLLRSTDDVTYTSVGTVRDSRPIVNTSLTALTTYYYKVEASNTYGSNGPSSRVTFVAPNCSPGAPTVSGVSASASCASGAAIRINFTAAGTAPITSTVYRSTTNSNNFADYTGNEVGNVVNGNFVVDTNVAPGSTYYYKVKAVNGAGESLPSAKVSATVPSTCVPPPAGNVTIGSFNIAPTNIIRHSLGGGVCKLNWSFSSVTPDVKCTVTASFAPIVPSPGVPLEFYPGGISAPPTAGTRNPQSNYLVSGVEKTTIFTLSCPGATPISKTCFIIPEPEETR